MMFKACFSEVVRVEGKPRTDDEWTLVHRKTTTVPYRTRHAVTVTNNGNPGSMFGSRKKSNPMIANGVGDGVGILRQSATGLKRLNTKVNWKAIGYDHNDLSNLVYDVNPPY
jgi:hypothetical protein